MKKYYFVSYATPRGFGNISIIVTGNLLSAFGRRGAEKIIREDCHVKDPVILFYKRISKNEYLNVNR